MTRVANGAISEPSPLISIAGWEFVDPDDMVGVFARAGADAVEVAPWNVDAVGVGHFRQLLARQGLVPSAVSTGAEFRINGEPLDLCRAVINSTIDLAVVLQADRVTTYMGDNADLDTDEAIEQFAAGIAPCARRAADSGVQLLVENMFDARGEDPGRFKPTRSPAGTAATMERVAELGVGLTLDPCNFLVAGSDPFEAYETLAPYIGNFHIKDARHNGSDSDSEAILWQDAQSTQAFRGVPVGEGEVRLTEGITAVVAGGYTGPLTIEHVVKRTDEPGREEKFRRAVEWVRRLVDAAVTGGDFGPITGEPLTRTRPGDAS